MKVRILKESVNYAYKIATMITAGKDNWNDAAHFLEMGIVSPEEMVGGLIKSLKEAEAERASLIKQYRAIEDEAYRDDVKWKEYVQLSVQINSLDFTPKNNIFEFFVAYDIKGEPLEGYINKVAAPLRSYIPRFDEYLTWQEAGFPGYISDDSVTPGPMQEMRSIMEKWRRQQLHEAAKNAKDLKNFYEDNWMEHNNMIRGLWNKYGMWKLGEMLNIGIPQEVQDKWTTYSAEQQLDYRRKVWDLMTQKKPPISVVIVGEAYGDSLEVSYGAIFPSMGSPARLLKFDSGEQKDLGSLMKKGKAMIGMPAGSITFHKPGKNDGECNDAWIVGNTHQTTKGWGPLLYDIAMEVATVLGGGLTSSRGMVSSKAKPVWDFYLSSRKDIDAEQMDIDWQQAGAWGLKQLTPKKPEDDCSQGSSYKWAHGEDYGAWDKRSQKSVWDAMRGMSDEEKENVPWVDQSISKNYKKDPEIIKFLGDNGLLHFPSLGYNAVEFHTSELPPLPPPEDEKPPPEKKEMEKARNQFRSQTTLSEKRIRIKIK